MQTKYYLLLIIPFIFYQCAEPKQEEQSSSWIISAPAGSDYTQIHQDPTAIIPNGRFVTRLGKQIQTAPHPYGLTLSPDGKIAVTANSGTSPFSITLIRDITSDNPEVQQVPPGAETDKGILAAVFMGLAITPDNQLVYVGGGQENKIFIFNVQTGEKEGFIDCATEYQGRICEQGYIGDLVLSEDGAMLYAVDQVNFRLIQVDVDKKEVIANIPTGRYPFGVALSPDESRAYVANVGMYEYQWIESLDTANLKESSLAYPPFGYLSKESEEGIDNDSVKVPGLGKPNVPESFSVWALDLDQQKVESKIKTGFLVGEMIEDFPAVGGASPNSVVATEDYVFVSNGNNDCISVIDPNKDSVITNIMLTPDQRLGNLRGVIPFGLALAPDGQRLFVAEAGINAVGVIDIPTLQVVGHIPVGWFPSKLKVTPDGKNLIVANAKGLGSGPNGGPDFEPGPEGSYVGALMKGYVSIFPVPTDQELEAHTQKVIENNFFFQEVDLDQDTIYRQQNPLPAFPGQKDTPIKHIVFISKENRTYDEVFGQLEKGRGEPTLARYGLNVSFSNRKGTKEVENADIMVNHHALAHRFAISDNFYVDSDHSADGHRWLVCTYPNEWVETSVSASYGGGRSMQRDSKAPGNLAFVGATGAIYPEDYNEAGSIWDHFDRHEVSFFNFGFGTELAPSFSDSTMKYTGVRYLVNYPVPGPLFDRSSHKYATYNMAIPDQFRADMFIEEFEEKWLSGKDTMPQVLTIILPNDHGSGDRPEAGYPFRESYMADNDLALGRIIEYLSNTPYWKNMAIVVTEDDSQDGRDHIDAHRSLLMLISPWAKKDYVGHHHYSFGSIFKTFWHLLGVPYLNQYDAGATDMHDLFTDQPDFTPYRALPVDSRVFEPQKALDPFDEDFDWEAVIESPVLDNVQDFVEAHQAGE